MGKILLATLALTLSSASFAGLDDCISVYVGKIELRQGSNGVYGVQFHASPGDGIPSQWQHLDTWTAEEKKNALSVLMTAKVSNKPVTVVTSDGVCDIATNQSQLVRIWFE